jgi:AraC-like DNA-binding protein
MLAALVTLLIGFSVIALAVLLAAYVGFFVTVQKTPLGIAACVVLCAGLAALQLEHLWHLQTAAPLLESWHYVALVFIVPPAFYLFSRDILLPGRAATARDALHAMPVALAPWLPAPYVAPLAFAIGAGYSLWLARVVYGMRRNVGRFRFEMFFFGLFAACALLVLGLVLSIRWIGPAAFYLSYAAAIGLVTMLVTAALLVFPEILSDLSEAAKLAYANSTLKGIDVAAKQAQLERLMATDKLYRNEDLSLAMLAEATGLSAHQLSELINTQFGVGFPRYVRERRVEEARRILREDRRSSALSIGMMCGFGSQSNFYAAFKEVTGESPAAFRKRQAGGAETPD